MLQIWPCRGGVHEARMNCRAGFYATIINIVAYPGLVGLARCVAGQRARAESERSQKSNAN